MHIGWSDRGVICGKEKDDAWISPEEVICIGECIWRDSLLLMWSIYLPHLLAKSKYYFISVFIFSIISTMLHQ